MNPNVDFGLNEYSCAFQSSKPSSPVPSLESPRDKAEKKPQLSPLVMPKIPEKDKAETAKDKAPSPEKAPEPPKQKTPPPKAVSPPPPKQTTPPVAPPVPVVTPPATMSKPPAPLHVVELVVSELVNEVISSPTTTPSVPEVVLAAIDDIMEEGEDQDAMPPPPPRPPKTAPPKEIETQESTIIITDDDATDTKPHKMNGQTSRGMNGHVATGKAQTTDTHGQRHSQQQHLRLSTDTRISQSPTGEQKPVVMRHPRDARKDSQDQGQGTLQKQVRRGINRIIINP